MPTLRSWPVRIVVTASAVVIGAAIDHSLTHRPLPGRLLFGTLLFGGILLCRYLDEVGQRRRTRKQERLSSAEERDAGDG